MNALHVRAPRATQVDVLIAGCAPELATRLSRTVIDLGCRAFVFDGATAPPVQLLQETIQVCICDASLSPSMAQTLWRSLPEQTQYLWLQNDASPTTAPFPAECVPHDITPRDWQHILKFAIIRADFQDRLATLESRLQRCLYRGLVCSSPAMQEFRQQLHKHASRETPLVLLGETGAAFSKTAWTTHYSGARSEAPYLEMDASAISADAFEQQLFVGDGLETGSPEPSLLEQLDGGTLFIRNIDTLARTTQKKLIRFIESPAIPRSDTLTLRYINLRMIVSSSAGPRERAQSPLLQYFAERSDSAQIVLPSLRDRADDLRPLAEQILVEQSSRLGTLPPTLDASAFSLIRAYDWPGNEDELTRVLTNLVHSSRRATITGDDLAVWIGQQAEEEASLTGLSLAEMERQLIETTFARCAGNREKTAQLLGIGLRTLSGKLRQYGYPPRGGPGSNRVRSTAPSEVFPERRAA